MKEELAQISLAGDLVRIKAPYAMLEINREIKRRIGRGIWKSVPEGWTFPATHESVELIAALYGERAEFSSDFLAVLDEARRPTPAEEDLDDRPFPKVVHPPWRHQAIAGRMIEKLDGVYLNHDMGCGKTKSVIDAIVNLDLKLSLIFCPLAVVEHWPKEIRNHAYDPLMAFALAGMKIDERISTLKQWALADLESGRVFVTNYESLNSRKFVNACAEIEWDLVVADEAQRVKSPGGVQSRGLAKIGKRSRKRVCLSGTPADKIAVDLYAQMRFCDPKVFGASLARYRARYCIMGGWQNREVVGTRNAAELSAKFFKVAHRVKKRDVLDLPPTTDETFRVDLEGLALKTYQKLEADFYAKVEAGEIVATNALTQALRLQQITSGFVGVMEPNGNETFLHDLHTHKIEQIASLVEDLPPDEPLVVFCRFKRDVAQVHAIAERTGRKCLELSGSRNDLSQWQESDGNEILAVQIQSGSEGVDFTRACYAIYFSVGYSLLKFDQSLARLDRPGQTRPVTYLHVIARGTIDEKVYRAFKSKRDAISAVLDRRDIPAEV